MKKLISFQQLKLNCKHINYQRGKTARCDTIDYLCRPFTCPVWKKLEEVESKTVESKTVLLNGVEHEILK